MVAFFVLFPLRCSCFARKKEMAAAMSNLQTTTDEIRADEARRQLRFALAAVDRNLSKRGVLYFYDVLGSNEKSLCRLIGLSQASMIKCLVACGVVKKRKSNQTLTDDSRSIEQCYLFLSKPFTRHFKEFKKEQLFKNDTIHTPPISRIAI